MPKPKKYASSFTFFVLAFGIIMYFPQKLLATSITVSPAFQVAWPNNVYPLILPWSGASTTIIDAPLTTFVTGGKRYWIGSRSLAQTKYMGGMSNILQTRMWTKESHLYFSDPHNQLGGPYRKIDNLNWTYGGGAPWIVNMYQIADSELLAFVHVEQAGLVNGKYSHGRSSIGLAYSNNAGETFKFLGDILQYDSTVSEDYNVQGAPYFIKDGYFYVYYHDRCPGAATTPARAPVTEVIQAARAGTISPWKKYYNGGFTSNGLGGPCSKIPIAVGIDHTDAAYSTHTGKYYITLSRGATSPGTFTWIKLYESTDGISWTFVGNIVEEPYPSEGGGYQYVTIVNANGSDNSKVGESFYVYSAKNIRNPSVYRWLVTLTGTTSTIAPSASPTVTPFPTQSPTRSPTARPTNTPTVIPTGNKTPTPTASINPSPTGVLKPGDINRDGIVNVIDIGIVIDNYDKNPPTDARSDVNGDGLVNILDIGVIVDNYNR